MRSGIDGIPRSVFLKLSGALVVLELDHLQTMKPQILCCYLLLGEFIGLSPMALRNVDVILLRVCNGSSRSFAPAG